MGKPLTAPARLAILLPWLNGDPLSPDEVRRRIAAFLAATADAWRVPGSTQAIGLVAPREKGSPWRGDRLAQLRTGLVAILDRAAPMAPRPLAEQALPSLRFDVARAALPGAAAVKRSALRGRQRLSVLGAGAYRMIVTGELEDLVTYCLMRTLTEPGGVLLARCPAPAPHNWSHSCGRWLVAGGQQRGRPREYCSLACRVRQHTKQKADAMRRRGTRRT